MGNIKIGLDFLLAGFSHEYVDWPSIESCFVASDKIYYSYRGTDKKQTILMKEERILFPGKVHAVPENQFIPPES